MGTYIPYLVDDSTRIILSYLSYKELVKLRCVSKQWLDCPKYTSEHWFDEYRKQWGEDFFIENWAKSAKLKNYHILESSQREPPEKAKAFLVEPRSPENTKCFLEEHLLNHKNTYGELHHYSLNDIINANIKFLSNMFYDDHSIRGFCQFYYLENGDIEGLKKLSNTAEYVSDICTPALLKRSSELNNRKMFIYCLKLFLECDEGEGPILICWPKNMVNERKILEKYYNCGPYHENLVKCSLGFGNYVISSLPRDQEDVEDVYIRCLEKIDILLGPPYIIN